MARAVTVVTGNAPMAGGPAIPAYVDNTNPAVGPALPVYVVTAASGVVLGGGPALAVRTAPAGCPVEGRAAVPIYLISGTLP